MQLHSNLNSAALAITLLQIQKIAREKRESSIPTSKRSSINLSGFRLKLPKQRYRAGTDEILVRQPGGESGPARSGTSLSPIDEAAVWEDMGLLELMEGILDEASPSGSSGKGSGVGGVAYKYHCAMAAAGGMGHADFHGLITSLASDARGALGTDVLLLSIACLTPVNEVSQLQLGLDGRTIRRFPAPGWERERSDVLHLPSNQWIDFCPPPGVLAALSRVLGDTSSGAEDHVRAAKERLSTCRAVTLARIREYILYNGPDEWGYSPAAAMLAWKGIGPRPGVYASYVRGDRIFRTLGDLYRLIDTGWQDEGVVNAFGCRHVPNVETVVELRDITTFENWTVPQGLAECRLKWNASGAGLNLLGCVLAGGTRNFVGGPPMSAAWSGAFIANREKRHVVPTVFSEYLREGLRHLEIAETAVQRAFSMLPPRPPGSAFGFWMEDNTACDVSPTTTQRALAQYPLTSHLSELHPNAMRALAMTTLYEEGSIHAHDIERFFGRAFSSMAPLCSHRLEPALDASLMRTIEQKILHNVFL